VTFELHYLHFYLDLSPDLTRTQTRIRTWIDPYTGTPTDADSDPRSRTASRYRVVLSIVVHHARPSGPDWIANTPRAGCKFPSRSETF